MPRGRPRLLTSRRAVAALVLGCGLGACHAPNPHAISVEHRPTTEQRYADWARPTFPAHEYAARRERLIALLREGGGVFLAPSSPGRSSGGTFRQLDDFLYFTGLELPDSVLAVDAATGGAALFVPERDGRFESASRPNDFPGRSLASDPDLARLSGIDRVRSLEELGTALAGWVAASRPLQLHVPGRETLEVNDEPWVHERTPQVSLLERLRAVHPEAEFKSAGREIARLRFVKSPAEVEVLRRACRITVEALRETARAVRDGVDERTLEGLLEQGFKRRGSQRVAFDSIVKSGPNSLWPWRVLAAHYDRRNRTLHAGELVIFDVGCELDHYASDIGRTFPVSGRFTPEQRDLLERVTAVSDAILAAVRPGLTLLDLQAVAQAAIPSELAPYMQTGLFFGHSLGLDVGDPSLAELPLKPGNVFTVEPWYYDHDRDLAVFIEDEVLVTADGCEVLSAGLPRSPRALERLMR